MEILVYKTRKEVANEYGISTKTLIRILNKEKIELPRGNISPKNLRVIYEHLGYPNRDCP